MNNKNVNSAKAMFDAAKKRAANFTNSIKLPASEYVAKITAVKCVSVKDKEFGDIDKYIVERTVLEGEYSDAKFSTWINVYHEVSLSIAIQWLTSLRYVEELNSIEELTDTLDSLGTEIEVGASYIEKVKCSYKQGNDYPIYTPIERLEFDTKEEKEEEKEEEEKKETPQEKIIAKATKSPSKKTIKKEEKKIVEKVEKEIVNEEIDPTPNEKEVEVAKLAVKGLAAKESTTSLDKVVSIMRKVGEECMLDSFTNANTISEFVAAIENEGLAKTSFFEADFLSDEEKDIICKAFFS